MQEAEGGGESEEADKDEKPKASTSAAPSLPWEALEMFMTARVSQRSATNPTLLAVGSVVGFASWAYPLLIQRK